MQYCSSGIFYKLIRVACTDLIAVGGERSVEVVQVVSRSGTVNSYDPLLYFADIIVQPCCRIVPCRCTYYRLSVVVENSVVIVQ